MGAHHLTAEEAVVAATHLEQSPRLQVVVEALVKLEQFVEVEAACS